MKRWVTDIPFLLAFIAFWLGMMVCTSMGLSEGDLTRLMYFVDYNGNRCGEGALEDYKYTHFTHWGNTGTNICVENCPTAANFMYTLQDNYIGGSGTNSSGTNIGYVVSTGAVTSVTDIATCATSWASACLNTVLS